MAFKGSKLYTFVNRIVKILDPKDYSDEIIKYDIDNKFPQNLILQTSESGTATSCIEALNQYAYADGLVDETQGKMMVNKTQTLNDLIEDIIQQAVLFQGVALHIMRDGSGKIIETKTVDFENCRKTKDYIVYNPTLSGTFDKSKDVKHPFFKGAKIDTDQLAEIVSFKNKDDKTVGEILYYYKRKPGQPIYPIPTFFSAISDINADAENSKFELESVNNSFITSGVLTLIGDIDDETEDEHGNTEWDNYNENLNNFTGNQKDGQGETGRQKLLVLHAKTKEEVPDYKAVSNEGQFNAIDKSTPRVAEKVARAFGVPPFLIGLGGNVGFATNIIADNITLFNNRITKIQKLALNPIKMCYPELQKLELTQLNPIKNIPSEVLAKLTDDELRALAGYKPKTITDVVQSVNN